MPATIRDIKDLTGLSLATISKYLNGGNVLQENRVKIEEAIEQLHYEPNEIARGLVTNRTKTVGVVIFRIDSLFSGILLRYLSDVLTKAGYGMLICDCANDEEKEAKNIKYLVSKKVDGIIILPFSETADFLQPAINAEVPVVLLDRSIPGSGFDSVTIDNQLAASQGTKLLINSGHKNIAVLSAFKEYTGRERFLGFMKAMKEAGLEVPEEYQKRGADSIEYGAEGMRELMALPNRPTAVFMCNYEITVGGIMALNEAGFKCPGDVSILGFDDLILSHLVQPKITTVVQPMQQFAEKAAEVLLSRIKEKSLNYEPIDLVLDTKLVEGNSIAKI